MIENEPTRENCETWLMIAENIKRLGFSGGGLGNETTIRVLRAHLETLRILEARVRLLSEVSGVPEGAIWEKIKTLARETTMNLEEATSYVERLSIWMKARIE